MRLFSAFALVLSLSFAVSCARAADASPVTRELRQLHQRYDVVIAGAGTGGTMAAIQAARLGASVLLTEETDWIGGQMTAAAVTSMDEGPLGSRFGEGRPGVRDRGLCREYSERAVAHYAKLGLSTDTCYFSNNRLAVEPHVGQAILYDMLRDASLSSTLHVALCTSASAVVRDEMKVTGVELAQDLGSGASTRTIQCAILIDATELGDLLPLTGARYRVGNLVRSGAWQPPSSSDTSTQSQATANPHVQDATWTAVIRGYQGKMPPGLFMQSPPPGYDRAIMARQLNNPLPRETTGPWSWERFICYRGMPDSANPDKTISNPWAQVTRTHMNVNVNDLPVTVRDIEEPERRLLKQRDLKLRTLQLLYYIQHDMKEPMSTWTVAADEGYDSPFNKRQNERLTRAFPELLPCLPLLNHFPVHAYMRESRRIVGMQTLCAKDIDRRLGPRRFAHSVAVGDYPTDLHGGRRPEDLEPGLDSPQDRGSIGFTPDRMGAFTVPFEVFVPEALDGFLAAEKNISQSRITNGATRLQPSTMLMGQAAGAIAALSVKHGLQPRHLRPARVQAALLDAKDILYVARGDLHRLVGVEPQSGLWNALQLCLLYGVFQPGEGVGGLRGWKQVNTGSQTWHSGANGVIELAGGMSAAVLERQADGTPLVPIADVCVTAVFAMPGKTGHAGVIGRFRDAGNFSSARVYRQRLELLQWTNGKVDTLASCPLAGIGEKRRVQLSARYAGGRQEAVLTPLDGGTSVSVGADGTTGTAGLAGLRAQAGTTSFKVERFEVRDSKGALWAAHQGGSEMRVTSDPLTRALLASLLTRQFKFAGTGVPKAPACIDVPVTHTAYQAVQKLAGAGVLSATTTSQGLVYGPDATVTRADLAVAVARALHLPQQGDHPGSTIADLPASHPAHSAVRALHAANVAPRFFRAGEFRFEPEARLVVADYALLFQEMLQAQPADVRENRYPGMVD